MIPHPPAEVEQLIRERILDFHTWLTAGLALPAGEGQPTCKDIAVEAVYKMEAFYNIIQNGSQFGILDENGMPSQVSNIFPEVSECVSCPEQMEER